MRVFGNLNENGLGCQVLRKKYKQTDNYLKFKTKDLVCFVDEWNIDSTKQIVIIKNTESLVRKGIFLEFDTSE